MDLGSRDYSLNFRGFEHNDPERVQRFKAFCEANFSLSPDRAHSILSSSATTVLTHSGSLEELEALAKVLREIGALVDVSEPDQAELLASGHLPSTQELHRLFARDREQALQEEEAVVAYVETKPNRKLRSTLDLLTVNIDVREQRKTIWDKSSSAKTQPTLQSIQSRTKLLVTGLSCLTLLGIGVAGALYASSSSSRVIETPPVFGVAQRPARQAIPLVPDSGPVRNLSARTNLKGVSIETKVLVSAKSLSISSLAISSLGSTTGAQSFLHSITDNATFRRAEGEPAFLTEVEPHIWQGDVIVSIFSDSNGDVSRISRTYQATVRLTGEQSGSLELRDAATGETSSPISLSSPN